MLSLIALALAAISPVHEDKDQLATAICRPTKPVPAVARNSPKFQKLNDLPNANLYLGVIRPGKEGCKSTIIRYDIGAAPKAQR